MNPRYLVAVFLWCLLSTGFQMLAMERPGMDSLAVAGSSNASASRGSRLTSPVANARAVGDEDTVGLLEAEFDCPGHQCSSAAGSSGHGSVRAPSVFPAAVPTAHVVTPRQLEAQIPAPQHGWFRRCIKCVFSPSEYKRRIHDAVNYFRNMDVRKRGRWGLLGVCLADIAGEFYVMYNPYWADKIILSLATIGSIFAKKEKFKKKLLGGVSICLPMSAVAALGMLPPNLITVPTVTLFMAFSGARDLVKSMKRQEVTGEPVAHA